MKLKVSQLRQIIREEMQRCHPHGTIKIMEAIKFKTVTVEDLTYKVIDQKTLERISPAAFKSADEDDLDYIWIMTSKPTPVSEPDESGFSEEWTETNEPELAESIAQAWDELAVNVDGKQVVILSGSLDDEYGSFWNESSQNWESYNY